MNRHKLTFLKKYIVKYCHLKMQILKIILRIFTLLKQFHHLSTCYCLYYLTNDKFIESLKNRKKNGQIVFES